MTEMILRVSFKGGKWNPDRILMRGSRLVTFDEKHGLPRRTLHTTRFKIIFRPNLRSNRQLRVSRLHISYSILD